MDAWLAVGLCPPLRALHHPHCNSLLPTLLPTLSMQRSQLQKFLEGSRFEQRRSMLEFDEVYEVGGQHDVILYEVSTLHDVILCELGPLRDVIS